MEFTRRYISDLTTIFTNRGNHTPSGSLEGHLNLENNNTFNKFMSIDVSKDEVEIPLYHRGAIEFRIKNSIDYPITDKCDRLVIPMYVNSATQHRRTADSIIKEFFTRVDINTKLLKVVTNKGEVYYGGKGLILDKDFTPLLLISLLGRKVIDSRMSTNIHYYKAVIHIHPKVFTEEQGLITKSIIKKVIPLYLSFPIFAVGVSHRFNVSELTGSGEGFMPEIVINDMSNLISSPITPSPDSCSNEALNELLEENIEEVINNLI